MESLVTLTIQKIESRDQPNRISRKISISEVESQLLLKMVEKHKVILLFEMHVPLMKEITRVNPLSSKPHQLGCMFLTVSCKD